MKLKNEITKILILLKLDKITTCLTCLILILIVNSFGLFAQNVKPDELKFVRQGVQRMIFDEDQSIPLAKLQPDKIISEANQAFLPITYQ
jgi:hypothetical protein